MKYSMADTIALHSQSKGIYNRSQRDMKTMIILAVVFCGGAALSRNPMPLGVGLVSLGFAIKLCITMVRAKRRERELAPQARDAMAFLNKACAS